MADVDANRSGWNQSESILSPLTISRIQFLWSYGVDGPIFGQPLVVNNVLYVCTMHNSCYAFDGSSNTQLWKQSLGISSNSTTQDQNFYNLEIGCVATPAIDQTAGLLFVVCGSNTGPSWVLFSLNLTTGAIVHQVTVSGSNGGATFDGTSHLMRPALTLINGNVYLFAGSYADIGTWHGWIFSYSESTLTQTAVFCSTPTGSGGAFWDPGGPPYDSSGNLFLVTGNGTYDGVSNFGSSILKLSPSLSVLDWFTPANYATLNSTDLDPASNRVILIPGTHYLVHVGKGLEMFVLDQTNLGHLQGSGVAPVQDIIIPGTASGISGPRGSLWMNNTYYIPNADGSLRAYQWTGSAFNTSPVMTSFSVGYPGPAMLSGTSNAANGGIVWTTSTLGTGSEALAVQPGQLLALDSSTLSPIWNTGSGLGNLAKFVPPTVANGKVYVASQDSLIRVYGIAPGHGGQAVHSVHSTAGGR